MDLADPFVLVGTWRLDRVIDDRRPDQRSRISGTLELRVLDEERIQWDEQGTWHRLDREVAVRRRLFLEQTAHGWWVRFEDGADFHPWAPGETFVHECAPDTYRGEVSGTPERWTVTWEVTGPGKDYTMTTVLTRESLSSS